MNEERKLLVSSKIEGSKELYKKMYNKLFQRDRIINILILLFLGFLFIGVISSGRGNIFSYVIILIMLIVFLFLFHKKDKKIKKIIEETCTNNHISTVNLYDNCIEAIYISGDRTIKKEYEYQLIKKVLEAKEYIYIVINNEVHIINKKDINIECINYLKWNVTLDDEKYDTKNKLNFILFITILSVLAGLMLIMICIILFNIPGYPLAMMEYIWMFLLFIPVPIYCIVIGVKYKKQGYKCLKNIVVGLIITIIFLIYGFGSFALKDQISHDPYNFHQVEKVVGMNFPDEGKISVAIRYEENVKKVVMVKFKNSVKDEVLQIVQNGPWRDHQDISNEYINPNYLSLTKNYDYFCLYNVSNKSFYSYGQRDNMIYLAYDELTNTLFIVDYYVNIK